MASAESGASRKWACCGCGTMDELDFGCAWKMRVCLSLCNEILIKFAKYTLAALVALCSATLATIQGELHSPCDPRWMANNAYQPQTTEWAAGHKPIADDNCLMALECIIGMATGVLLDRLWLLRSERVRSFEWSWTKKKNVGKETPSSQMPNMKFFEINFCFSYRAACPHWERTSSYPVPVAVAVAVQTTGYCAKRDDAFKILPIGHYCLAFNAASLTALLIDLLIDVVVLLSLPVPVATLAAPWLAATADDRKSS